MYSLVVYFRPPISTLPALSIYLSFLSLINNASLVRPCYYERECAPSSFFYRVERSFRYKRTTMTIYLDNVHYVYIYIHARVEIGNISGTVNLHRTADYTSRLSTDLKCSPPPRGNFSFKSHLLLRAFKLRN